MAKITKDVTLWLTNELHKMLTKVIMAKESHPRIYYILVIMKDGYEGQSMASKDQKTIDLSSKRVIHNRLILLNEPPRVPMISSSLWRIDNKIGEAKCMYILPPDKPIMYGVEMGEASKFIWKSAQGAPLVYGSNN